MPDMKVLSFAVVGSQGREYRTRFASLALALAILSGPAVAQPSDPFVDLAPDLASKIADALSSPTAVRLVFPTEAARIQSDVTRALSARGFRVVDGGEATVVNGRCGANLRERVCVAEIGRGDARRVVMSTRMHDAGALLDRGAAVGVELRPLYTQRDPMLDAVETGGGLLVLTPGAVLLVGRGGSNGGSSVSVGPIVSAPITTSRVWPRDLRGTLRATDGGFEAFLPGVTCRGKASPFTVSCADESEPWPIGPENSGIAPSRNTFSTPAGLTFYEAAALDGGRWLVVSEQGVSTFVDARYRVVARSDAADHAAGFPRSCAADPHVVIGKRGPDSTSDALQLFRVDADRVVAMPSTLVLPGILTALWSGAGNREATAIVHEFAAGRYEAFHVFLSCAR
jgi:hypothetical protein